jgi:spore maturation protein CgeB
MIAALTQLKKDAALRRSLAKSGLETICARHTCAHRARELLDIVKKLRSPRATSRGVRAGQRVSTSLDTNGNRQSAEAA